MGLIDNIKKEAQGNRTKIPTKMYDRHGKLPG